MSVRRNAPVTRHKCRKKDVASRCRSAASSPLRLYKSGPPMSPSTVIVVVSEQPNCRHGRRVTRATCQRRGK